MIVLSCGDDDPGTSTPAPLPLDAVLSAGQTRAGPITKASELLLGPHTRGRVGDFKLYNAKIALIIGAAEDGRGYNPYGGQIVDADRIRSPGSVSHSSYGEVVTALDLAVQHAQRLEVVADGRDGGAAIVRAHGKDDPLPLLDALLANLFSAQDYELSWAIDYVLEPDSNVVRIDLVFFNEGRTTIEAGLILHGFIFGDQAQPFLPGHGFRWPSTEAYSDYYAATGDDITYIYGDPGARLNFIISESGLDLAGARGPIRIRARETITLSEYLIVGDGDLSRAQAEWRKLAGGADAFEVSGQVLDDAKNPVADAYVHAIDPEPRVEGLDYVTRARTDAEGRYSVVLEPGAYRLIVHKDGIGMTEPRPIRVEASPIPDQDFTMKAPGFIEYDFESGDGGALPVKLTLVSKSAAGRPPTYYGIRDEPGGVLYTEYGITGAGRFPIQAGDYELHASRGIEHEVATFDVTVQSGGTLQVGGPLERRVHTDGWISTDTHVHSQLSPDSSDSFEFKVQAMVVEGLEMPISTEHEAIGDFNPAIRELGLEPWIKGVIGSEITTFTYGHFNAWPLIPDFDKPGNGRIDWYGKEPGETFAAIRENTGAPMIQVNHPRAASVGGYFSAMGLRADTLGVRRVDSWSDDFDAIEVANGCSVRSIEQETMPDWFAFLNAGYRKYATGSTDSHHAGRGEMGIPRTYVRVPKDDPAEVTVEEFVAATKAGRMTISCGPFLEMRIGSAEVGDTVPVSGDLITIDARVEASSWVDVDQLEVIVDGELKKIIPIAPSAEPVRFSGTVTASTTPGKDGWVILRVRGDQNHGIWARGRPSYGFTNAIYLDGDRDGKWGR